jgi:hypothetical protein
VSECGVHAGQLTTGSGKWPRMATTVSWTTNGCGLSNTALDMLSS